MDKAAISTMPKLAKTTKTHPIVRILTRSLLYLVIIAGAIIFIFPFFWMISTSLMTLGETISKQLLPKVPQWENYIRAWNEANFSKYFLNSVLITLGSITGLLFTSILAGYAFGRIEFKGKNFIFGSELHVHSRCCYPTSWWHLAKHLLGTDRAIFGKCF